MAQKIKAAVGKKGKNQPEDVKVVQELLNAVAGPVGFTKLKVDGIPTPKLNEAIGMFQAAACSFKPDQTVEPNKNTWKTLIAGPSKLKAAQKTKDKEDEKTATAAAEAAKKKALEAARKAAEKQAKPVKAAAEEDAGFWDFFGDVADSVEKAADEAIKKAIELAKKTGKSIEEEVDKLMGNATKEAERKAAEAAKKAAEAAKKAAEEARRKAEEEAKKNEPDPNKKGTLNWKSGVDKNVNKQLLEVLEIVAGHFDKAILVVGGRRDQTGQINAMYKGWNAHLEHGTIYPALRSREKLRLELDAFVQANDKAGFTKCMKAKCPWSSISRHLSGDAVDVSTSTDGKIIAAIKDCLYYLPESDKAELDEKGEPTLKCHHFSTKKYTKPTVEIMRNWKKK